MQNSRYLGSRDIVGPVSLVDREGDEGGNEDTCIQSMGEFEYNPMQPLFFTLPVFRLAQFSLLLLVKKKGIKHIHMISCLKYPLV